MLDILSRELKVLIVVSAGNQEYGRASSARDAEEALADFPDYLFHPDCGLCEPATAAIPITVGSVAEYAEPAVRRGSAAENFRQAVAGVHEPTPTTRIGPGLNGAVKPEFVAPGGNVLFEGMTGARRAADDDPGGAVMSLSHTPLEGLFRYGAARSYAAPRVANLAAHAWHSLTQYAGEEPTPTWSAPFPRCPRESRRRFATASTPRTGPTACKRSTGTVSSTKTSPCTRATDGSRWWPRSPFASKFSWPSRPRSPRSSAGRTGKARGCRARLRPPVRRRRAEYLGVELYFSRIWGKTRDEVVEAHRAVSTAERDAAKREERRLQGHSRLHTSAR